MKIGTIDGLRTSLDSSGGLDSAGGGWYHRGKEVGYALA